MGLPDVMGLFAIANRQNEIEVLLGTSVDLITKTGLKTAVGGQSKPT